MFDPPPPHAARFHSDDLDEVHAFIARYDGDHRRTVLESGRLGYRVRALRFGNVDIGWGSLGVRQKIEGVPRGAILHLPLARRHVYTTGGRVLEARPDTAILLAPGQEYAFHFEPDDCLTILRIPGDALTREIAARDPARAASVPAMRELPLTGRRLGALAAMRRTLVDATNPTPGDASAPRPRQLEARLCSWMVDQVLGTRPSSGTPALAIQRIRTVEEWIDVHLADPITLGRLCAVAGVGDRCLESAFRTYRGQTPMQFVASRRLAAVRRSLLEAKPGDSVTQIAHDAGFVHLGRFAARYRRNYSESPSATLRHRAKRT